MAPGEIRTRSVKVESARPLAFTGSGQVVHNVIQCVQFKVMLTCAYISFLYSIRKVISHRHNDSNEMYSHSVTSFVQSRATGKR